MGSIHGCIGYLVRVCFCLDCVLLMARDSELQICSTRIFFGVIE